MMKTLLLNDAAPTGLFGDPIVMIMLMVIAMVVFIWLPNRKRKKEEASFLESIGKGTNIVTVGQVHGKIVKVEENTIIVEVDSGARMKINKSGISKDLTEQAYK